MNETIFYTINSIAGRSYLLDQTLIFFSDWFGIVLLLGLFVFLVFHTDKKRGAQDLFVVFVVAVSAYAVAVIIKELIISPRPFEVLPSAHVLYTHGGGDSVPSGHATFYMALAVALFFYHRNLFIVYALGAIIIGLARIAVGVHWPFDIVTGWILGGVVGVLVYRIVISLSVMRKRCLNMICRKIVL